jgi:WD40 repeat protein
VVKVWETATGRQLLAIPLPAQGLGDLAFSPDGELLATTSELGGRGVVNVWSARTGRAIRTLTGHQRPPLGRGLAFSPDGRRLASAGDGEVKVWELATGKEVSPITEKIADADGVAFSPDGKRLACACRGEAKVWDVAAGEEARALKGGGHSVAFSPDGTRLASASPDRLVRVWDAASG